MNPSSNVFLVGPMGAGKSSTGRQIAERFGLQWIDLDAAIEQRTGARIATLFEIEGEPGFRRREATLLAELAQRDDCVLATGGGAVLAPENRTLLRTRGFVVWLAASVEQQLRRLARDRQRPLLAAPDRRQRLEQLARERDPLYRELADLVLASTGGSARHTAARVIAELEQHWQRTPATRETV